MRTNNASTTPDRVRSQPPTSNLCGPQDSPLRLLHVVLAAGPTNSQYNEHCLPVADQRELAICSLFPASVVPPPAITLFEGDGSLRGCVRVLRAALRDRPYDIVHVHAPPSAVVLLLVKLFRHQSLARCVFTMHNSFLNFRLRSRLLLRVVFAIYPTLVVCGEAAQRTLPFSLRLLGGRRIVVAPNGVDLDRVDRVRTGLDENAERGSFAVVSVGRLIALKNPAALLEAFARGCDHNDHLVFVGDGDLRHGLSQLANRLGIAERVAFSGLVPRDEVYRYIAAADVFVSVSGGEGLPVAVLEAMACGIPVILSDIPPHREIADGVDFVPLVSPDDVEGFSEQLRRFRRMPRSKRMATGQRCRNLVEDRFSVRAMHEAYARIYVQAVAGLPPAGHGFARRPRGDQQ